MAKMPIAAARSLALNMSVMTPLQIVRACWTDDRSANESEARLHKLQAFPHVKRYFAFPSLPLAAPRLLISASGEPTRLRCAMRGQGDDVEEDSPDRCQTATSERPSEEPEHQQRLERVRATARSIENSKEEESDD